MHEYHFHAETGIDVKSIISLSLCAGILFTGAFTAPAAANSSAIFPAGPHCPDRAPAGWEFVRAVQPPWGLPYDLYRLRLDDGTYEYRQIYC
ncbi:hypothetical protein [Nonomuraea sp. NPDC005650]|uniref:hypothetical protein n=1 Tax=Nonomuraea sp. NPDC005650 TaxID=3157045 RepID=UPI0033B51DA6